MYYVDMQKFPLRMKDNDLLVTELYRVSDGFHFPSFSLINSSRIRMAMQSLP